MTLLDLDTRAALAPRSISGDRLRKLVAERTGDPVLGHEAHVVSQVLPFKVSSYVIDELIDWGRAPDDPIYRLTFPSSLFTATMVFDVCIPARCWMAPEMPSAMYSCGETVLPVWPTWNWPG